MTEPSAAHQAPPPLTGRTRAVGTLVLSLATFMNVLDHSIANVSLPAIAGDLGASVHQSTRVITAFGIATAISVPLTGWLAARFGQVRLFVSSVLLFTLASWLCGMAPSLEWLIAFRVLQGLVAGPMMPLSQTLLLASHPPERAGKALGIWSMTTLIAPVVGPLLGGFMTDHIAWPWIFYINVPIGLFCALLTWTIYRDRDSVTRRMPVDLIGLVLLIIWVGSLQTLLDTGKEENWFESGYIVTLALVAAVGFVVFLIWELTAAHPIVDLRLFSNRNFALGTISLAGGFAVFSGTVVLMPLWLQQAMGYTATWAALVLAPVGVVGLFCSPIAGRGVDRGRARTVAIFAFMVYAWSFWLRSLYNTESDYVTIMLPMILQGVAGSMFFITMSAISLSQLQPAQFPLAAGLNNFVRISAGAFGTSIATTMWSSRSQMHRTHLVDEASRTGWSLEGAFWEPLRSAGASLEQTRGMLERMIEQQALTLGANDVFLIAAGLYLLLILPVSLAAPVRPRVRVVSQTPARSAR